MKKLVLTFAAISCCCGNALASETVEGRFKADAECDAYVSFKKKTNPDSVKTKIGEIYDAKETNKARDWEWIRISINNDLRWVEKKCGSARLSEPSPTAPRQRAATDEHLLSISWQPAFCEGHSDKSECKNESNDSFAAAHFTLHGLWPQPNGNFYCDVSPEEKQKADSRKWCELPELNLDMTLRNRLEQQMPGTQSCLDRYEWTKHGTCYHKPEQVYFEDSLALLEQLNASAVQKLFAEHVGEKVTTEAIRKAFDQSFGPGAGEKVEMSCQNDGSRRLFVEMRIQLKGELGGAKLADALKAARKSSSGCAEGIVDPVGLQ